MYVWQKKLLEKYKKGNDAAATAAVKLATLADVLNTATLPPGYRFCEGCSSAFHDYHGEYKLEWSRSRCGSCHYFHTETLRSPKSRA